MATRGTQYGATTEAYPASRESGEHGQGGRFYKGAQEVVHRHPTTSVLTMFGLGFGMGILLGCALAESARPRRRWYDPAAAERLGREMLDVMSHMWPDSLTKRMS